jgi:HAD superfamily hydrolase (TIGR01450 family)
VPLVLTDYHAVMLDLDGTLYHEEYPLPGAVDFVNQLKNQSVRFALLSNSTTSPARIWQRLMHMGITVEVEQIYTAASAAADLVMASYGDRPRVFNLASEGVKELLDGKVDWVETGGEPCDAVIVGTPVNVYATEDRQRIALQLARKGAALIGICADRVYPSARGIEFGSGALSWMLGYASSSQPVFCGKPQRVFLEYLCNRLGVDPGWVLLIGDNVEADVAGAKAMGMRTVLVLTGVTRRRDLLSAPANWQPDLVVEDLTRLL